MSIDPMILGIVKQLLLAVCLGGVIGLERWYRRKPAGLRTYALVSLGACIFTLTSVMGGGTELDTFRIVSQVVVGIGFLGAGIIFRKEDAVQGLTTAAGLWVTAAIGATVGIHLYILAIISTAFALAIFFFLFDVEKKIPRDF